MKEVVFTSPKLVHASAIQTLVEKNKQLDNNSAYLYSLWCKEFADNSAVALKGSEVYAFITGFRRPTSPETYFLWQTAAKKRHGIPNLGVDLIHFAVEREINKGARAIEASVDTENTSIVLLLKTLAKRLGGDLKKDILFSSEQLTAGAFTKHHDETLYRIELD